MTVSRIEHLVTSGTSIVRSIRDRLLVLPPGTAVRTGHGESATIGAEALQLGEWVDRGY